ncbi:MAG: hypothetical protein B5766_03530, partial [Candidatus Lumbricidophila eiseniae]
STPNASTATSNPRDATRLHTQLDKLLLEVLSSHCRAPTGPGIISEPARTMLKKPKTTTYRP